MRTAVKTSTTKSRVRQSIPVLTFGERIKITRKKLGYVNSDSLADELNVARNTIQRWERDENLPSIVDIAELAAVLHVPLTWLLEGIEGINTTSFA